MNPTQDDYVFKKTNQVLEVSQESKMHDTYVQDKPMLDKQILSVQDQNGGSDYFRNESKFNTLNLGTGGILPNYREGYIMAPVCVRVHREPLNNAATPFSDFTNYSNSTNQIQFKSCSANLIDMMRVDYANENVVQARSNLNGYVAFKKHSEYSVDDTLLNAPKNGYYKPTSNWKYDTKEGMKAEHDENLFAVEFESSNDLSVLSKENIEGSGVNYVQKVSNFEYIYYYFAIIPLKDYPFFKNFPLTLGANMDITLNFNQVTSTIVYTAGVKTSIHHSLKGSTNPLLRINEPQMVAPLDDANFTETITLSIGQVQGSGKLHPHPLKQCRLYVPCYTLSPLHLNPYLKNGNIKKIVYEDVIVKHLVGFSKGDSIDSTISNNVSNFKHLLIVPMLSKNSNVTEDNFSKYSPQQTCFAQEPSVCSPYEISNFNVKIGSTPIYKTTSDLRYKHDTFMLEMNGAQGVNGNLDDGFTSGQIDLKSYVRNMGYIYVDLSRRTIDDVDKPFSIEISGQVKSPKSIDLLCYLVVQKQIIIDVATGAIVQQ